MSLPTLDEVRELVYELKQQNADRNLRDAELENLFLKGQFTGMLGQALNSQVRTSKQGRLLLNLCRNQMIDRVVLLTMLPDIKVDPPGDLPGLDQVYWQEMIQHTIEHYFWEQVWGLPQRAEHLAFPFAVKGRTVLQLFPNYKTKTIDLWLRDPSTYYAVVSGGASGQSVEGSRDGFTSGGYVHSPVLFIYKAKGREILRDYPMAGVEPDSTLHEIVEWWDENIVVRFIEDKAIHPMENRAKPGLRFRHLKGSDGDISGIEHRYGFVPTEFVQDVHIPGRIDGTTSIYHSIAMAENLNDLINMMTEEQRSRLDSVLAIKSPIDVPNPLPDRNAVVTFGPDGEARWLAKTQGSPDMASHIEAVKQMAFMSLGTSGARMGELPSSGPWIGKGLNAAASVAISDEVLLNRQKLAMAIMGCNTKAYAMARKNFGSVKQKMTVHSSAGSETMTFKFNELPPHFRHKLEVFPLAHDVPGTAVLFMQLEQRKLVSKQAVREKIPGIDAALEKRRVADETQEEMQQMLAAQQAQMAAQQQAQMAAQGAEGEATAGAGEGAEAENYAMERGGMMP
jgi:hypothetical protein